MRECGVAETHVTVVHDKFGHEKTVVTVLEV